MGPDPHKRQKRKFTIRERDRNVVRAPCTAETSNDVEIQRISEYQINELKAMNQTSFVDVLHTKLGSCGQSQVILWKFKKLRANTKMWKHACYVDECLGKPWASEFYPNSAEAREACAYKILRGLELLLTVDIAEHDAAIGLLKTEDHKSREEGAAKSYEMLEKNVQPIVRTNDSLISPPLGLPVRYHLRTYPKHGSLKHKRTSEDEIIPDSAPFSQTQEPVQFSGYIQAAQHELNAPKNTDSIAANCQQVAMLSQASNQLHTVQPSHAPTIPTTSLLLTPPSVAYPVAVDAFEQHVDVGPVPFFIYPDLRPLLPPGIAINENGPSHYNEKGECIVGPRDRIAAQMITEPFNRMRALGNEHQHNAGLAAIMSLMTDGEDFRTATPAARGNFLAGVINGLISGVCSNGSMTSNECFGVLGAMVESHLGTPLTAAPDHKTFIPQPDLGQVDTFPRSCVNFPGPSTQSSDFLLKSQLESAPTLDAASNFPNGASGWFLGANMDLDSASTQEFTTALIHISQPPITMDPTVSSSKSSTVAPMYASNMSQAAKTSGSGISQGSAASQPLSSAFQSRKPLASASNFGSGGSGMLALSTLRNATTSTAAQTSQQTRSMGIPSAPSNTMHPTSTKAAEGQNQSQGSCQTVVPNATNAATPIQPVIVHQSDPNHSYQRQGVQGHEFSKVSGIKQNFNDRQLDASGRSIKNVNANTPSKMGPASTSITAQAADAPSTTTQTPGTSFGGQDAQSSSTNQAGGGPKGGNCNRTGTPVMGLQSRLMGMTNSGRTQSQPTLVTTPHPRRALLAQVPTQSTVAASHVPPQFKSFLSGARSGAPWSQFPVTLSQPFHFGATAPMGSPQVPAQPRADAPDVSWQLNSSFSSAGSSGLAFTFSVPRAKAFQFGAITSVGLPAMPVSQSTPQPAISATIVPTQPSQQATATLSANAPTSNPKPVPTLEDARLDPTIAASLQNLLNNR